MTGSPTIYAIGDIHGRHDLLCQLLEMIADDAGGEQYRLVFLGDYIDRGARSRAVIERLFALNTSMALQPVFLRGNHEDTLGRVLQHDNPELTLRWAQNRANGGAATLRSYGVVPPTTLAEAASTVTLMRNAMPATHLEFLRGLRDHFTSDQFFFAHAGVDPRLPLHLQQSAILVHGTTEFLASQRTYAKTVVHGHWRTLSYMPEIHNNRIAIDTGAELTGNLTAVRLKRQAEPYFLMTCAY